MASIDLPIKTLRRMHMCTYLWFHYNDDTYGGIYNNYYLCWNCREQVQDPAYGTNKQWPCIIVVENIVMAVANCCVTVDSVPAEQQEFFTATYMVGVISSSTFLIQWYCWPARLCTTPTSCTQYPCENILVDCAWEWLARKHRISVRQCHAFQAVLQC